MLTKSLAPLILFFFFLASAGLIISPATATDHIVGANKGWNPGINYTSWVHNHTFYTGDFISFRYKKNIHNVFEVNKTSYENCTIEGAVGNWSSGKDFIPLNKTGRHYFICGAEGGCSGGMKVSIMVHALPPPPTASISATGHSTESSRAAPTKVSLGRPLVVSGALLMSFLGSVLMGS